MIFCNQTFILLKKIIIIECNFIYFFIEKESFFSNLLSFIINTLLQSLQLSSNHKYLLSILRAIFHLLHLLKQSSKLILILTKLVCIIYVSIVQLSILIEKNSVFLIDMLFVSVNLFIIPTINRYFML